ncbi:hypothetical protein LINPERHAP1_LOCUS14152 [Linum perenne]
MIILMVKQRFQDQITRHLVTLLKPILLTSTF